MASNVHVIDDITHRGDLIRYAVDAQIHHIQTTGQIVAAAVGMSDADLIKCLAGEAPFSIAMLRDLDDAFVALGRRHSRTGGLAQFGARLFQMTDETMAKIPPSWTRDILETRAADELHVLIQASTLLTHFSTVARAGVSTDDLKNTYAEEIERVADQLILIAGGPPTAKQTEAQVLLGNLAMYAFDIVSAQLEWNLSRPLGFRTWHSITRLVMIGRGPGEMSARLVDNLRPWLQRLIPETHRLRPFSIYPGRSLDLEFLISIPSGWLDEPDDPVDAALVERALENRATLRERGTAAMGLWQRGYENGRHRDPAFQAKIADLIHKLRTQTARPDIAAGLEWVAATLESAVKDNVSVCNTWPTTKDTWHHAVTAAVNELDRARIPEAIGTATKSLFLHILQQNAGVERRWAIETLTAGGHGEAVAKALGHLLLNESSVTWLRIRALFALGHMQLRNVDVQNSLVVACQGAAARIRGVESPPQAAITELQTALFAVGDICGAKGAEKFARTVRTALESLLKELVKDRVTEADESRYPIARALAYMLTFTAQPARQDGTLDLSQQLLNELSHHPDQVTRDLCTWALGFRFGASGEIRSVLDGG
jgi:hypothetical protein